MWIYEGESLSGKGKARTKNLEQDVLGVFKEQQGGQ